MIDNFLNKQNMLKDNELIQSFYFTIKYLVTNYNISNYFI